MISRQFEYGWRVLRDAMHRSPFPVLAANLFYEGTDIPFVQPYTIVERDGFRLGVVGILGIDAATALFPPHLAGIEVRDPVVAAQGAVARLRPDVDLIVLLTHQGKIAPMQTDDEADLAVQRDIEADIRVAGLVEGIDVLIGGHADAGQETSYGHSGSSPVMRKRTMVTTMPAVTPPTLAAMWTMIAGTMLSYFSNRCPATIPNSVV